jgi:hypothetical protein
LVRKSLAPSAIASQALTTRFNLAADSANIGMWKVAPQLGLFVAQSFPRTVNLWCRLWNKRRLVQTPLQLRSVAVALWSTRDASHSEAATVLRSPRRPPLQHQGFVSRCE